MLNNTIEYIKAYEFYFLGSKFTYYCNNIEKKYIIDYLYTLQYNLEKDNYNEIDDNRNIVEIAKNYLILEEGIDKKIVDILDTALYNFTMYSILNKLREDLDTKVIQFKRKRIIDNILK